MLDRVPPRVDPAAVAAMEQGLVGAAPGLTSDELRALLIRAEATLDPDGVEQKERELRDARYLIVREDRAGAILVDGRFDRDRCTDQSRPRRHRQRHAPPTRRHPPATGLR